MLQDELHGLARAHGAADVGQRRLQLGVGVFRRLLDEPAARVLSGAACVATRIIYGKHDLRQVYIVYGFYGKLRRHVVPSALDKLIPINNIYT